MEDTNRSRLDAEIEEEDRDALRRQRNFREAAHAVARELGRLPSVDRVLLFGSVARELERERPRMRRLRRRGSTVLHQCKDVDLAVHVTYTAHLRDLQRARVTGLKRVLEEENIGVAHHQVDVFLLEPGTDCYLGRLCSYRTCPAEKPECRVPGCGAWRYLQQHEEFEFDAAGARAGAIQLHPPEPRAE